MSSRLNITEETDNVKYCNIVINLYNKGYYSISNDRAYELYNIAIQSKLALQKRGIEMDIIQPNRY